MNSPLYWVMVLFFTCMGFTRPSFAHTTEFSILTIKEITSQQYLVKWKPSPRYNDLGERFKPVFNVQCNYQPPKLTCGESTYAPLTFDGLPDRHQVMVRLEQISGESSYHLTQGIAGASSEPMDEISSLINYLFIGVEHIVFGFDHLLFVLTLLFLVGFSSKLIWCITGFTISHSVSLVLSAFGWVTVSITPIEIIIALSIVLMAREALSKKTTFTHRYPWLVALLFGLIHGLGFASALSEIGLPKGQEIIALIGFNLGVEVGQLVILFLAYTLFKSSAWISWIHQNFARIKTSMIYSCGIAGTVWAIQRFAGA